MARGMPPRPVGGGRPQPARRVAQPKQQPKQPLKQPSRQPSKQPAKSAQRGQKQSQVTRQALEQQRRAAKAAQGQQHRLRQQVYLREAHTERRKAEAEQRTAALQDRVAALESILTRGLVRSSKIDLEALYQPPPEAAPFDPGPLGTPAPEPAWEQFSPGGLAARFGPQVRRQRQAEAARRAWEDALDQWRLAEQERHARLAAAQQAHEEQLAAARERVEQYNSRIARVAAGLRTREPAVVASFLRTVLARVPLPAGFPRRYEVSHDPAQEQVTIRFVLPGRGVVPVLRGYRYQAAVDELTAVPRPEPEAQELYRQVLAQVVLLVARDVFEAEPAVAALTLHGLVDQRDPVTGKPVFGTPVLLQTDRTAFEQRDLAGEDPVECLRQLGAEITVTPTAAAKQQGPAQPATAPPQQASGAAEQAPAAAEAG